MVPHTAPPDGVRADRVLHNPRTGQRLTVRVSPDDSDGALLELEAWYPAGWCEPAVHHHPHQEERGAVLDGCLLVSIDGRTRTYHPGEEYVVPAGARHTMRAGGDRPARTRWQVRPALATLTFLETAFALAAAGRTDDRGVPSLLQVAVLLERYADVWRFDSPPWPVQRALAACLGPVGRRLGLRAVHTLPDVLATELPR